MTSMMRNGCVILAALGGLTVGSALAQPAAPPPASLLAPSQGEPAPAGRARPAPAKKAEPARAKKAPEAKRNAPARPAKQAAPTPSKTPPAQGLQGWFPMPQGASPAPTAQPATPVALTPERVRPPAGFLIDCKDAPPSAVTQVPEPLNRWATIYCTKRGHIFSPNDQFFALYPGTKIRGALNAAELTGRTGELGHAAHFTRVVQTHISPADAKSLMVGLTPETARIVEGKELLRVDLTTDTGQTFSLAAVNPNEDPFWVIPVVDGKLNNRGFFVASLDYMNKNR